MRDFLISEIFRLDIRWEDVIYNKEGVCTFVNACLSGPAIQIAGKIKNNDFIMLDFYSQYIKLVRGVYVGKFYWGEAKYSDDGGTVFLANAGLSHTSELHNVPNLGKDDFFAVDTSNHTVEKHLNNLVYRTYVLNNDNQLYRFDK